MKARFALVASLVLAIAACGGSGSTATTTAERTTTTEPSTTSQDTATAPESSSSSQATAPVGQFAITRIDFENSVIEFTNVSDEPADIGGLWICQRPSYFQIGNAVIEPGESHSVDGGTVGGLDPASGEVGLYLTNGFSTADQIVSYVEWGESGHGRSSVAVSAGIWADGGFVATESSTASISSTGMAATGPGGWTNG